jgi:hypothetical protein
MKRRRITAASLILVLALLSLSFKCGGSQPTDQVRQAAKAADDIAAALKGMTQAKRDLLSSGIITKDESNKLTQLLLKVEEADRAFKDHVKQVKQFDATNKSDLAKLCAIVTSAIDDLNSSGVLGVQNADAKSKLSTFINTIKGLIGAICPLLQ